MQTLRDLQLSNIKLDLNFSFYTKLFFMRKSFKTFWNNVHYLKLSPSHFKNSYINIITIDAKNDVIGIMIINE